MKIWQNLYAGDGAFKIILAVAIGRASDVTAYPARKGSLLSSP